MTLVPFMASAAAGPQIIDQLYGRTAEQQFHATPFPQPAPKAMFTSQEFLRQSSTILDHIGNLIGAAFDPTSTATAPSLTPFGPPSLTMAQPIEEPVPSAPRPGNSRGRFWEPGVS